MSTTTEQAVESPTRPRRPWRLIILAIVILPFFLLLNWHLYFYHAGSGDLATAIAEADRLDPGWRWDELQAKREVIPDAENSALQIIKIVGLENDRSKALVPAGWGAWESDYKLMKDWPWNDHRAPIPPKLAEAIRAELTKIPLAVAEARKLADMPKGRFPILAEKDLSRWYPVYPQGIRKTANLLHYDACLLANGGKIDESVRNCQAMVHVAGSIGDESTLVSVLVHLAIRGVAEATTQRILAQGQASEKSLAALQRTFENYAGRPLLLNALRGKRTLADRYLDALQTGEIPMARILDLLETTYDTKPWRANTGMALADGFVNGIYPSFLIGPLPKNRATLLRWNSRMVEIAKLPAAEQGDAMDRFAGELKAQADSAPKLARLSMPDAQKVPFAFSRTQAVTHSMIAALAVERYRVAHGRWPDTLKDVVPAYLVQIPADPFGKGMILYRRNADGVVLYSVAGDKVDDGGNLDPRNTGLKPGTDIGVRL